MIKRHKYLPAAPDDTTIWHYMSIPNFLYLLDQKHLYFSRVDNLEDKAEILVSDIEKDYWRKYFPTDIDKWVTKERKRIFVNCWIKSEVEISTMWSAYASQGTGVAIKTTVKQLIDSYRGNETINILDINYIDHRRQTVQPPGEKMNVLRFFSSKRIFYSQEQELRLIYEAKIDEELDSFNLPIDINILIEELHVGPFIRPEMFEMIKTIVPIKGGRFPILESEMLYH